MMHATGCQQLDYGGIHGTRSSVQNNTDPAPPAHLQLAVQGDQLCLQLGRQLLASGGSGAAGVQQLLLPRRQRRQRARRHADNAPWLLLAMPLPLDMPLLLRVRLLLMHVLTVLQALLRDLAGVAITVGVRVLMMPLLRALLRHLHPAGAVLRLLRHGVSGCTAAATAAGRPRWSPGAGLLARLHGCHLHKQSWRTSLTRNATALMVAGPVQEVEC